MWMRLTRRILVVVALCTLIAACNGGGPEEPPKGQAQQPEETDRPASEDAVPQARLTPRVSDAHRFEARAQFPSPTMVSSTHEGTTYTEVSFAGLQMGTSHDDQVGAPAVQMMYRLLAVPIGARPNLEVLNVRSRRVGDLLLRPHQPSPVDGDRPAVKDGELPPPEIFMDAPFTKDEKAYRRDGPHPQQVVSMRRLGKMRDLEILMLAIAPMQYNAARQELTLHEAVDFRVDFVDGKGTFLPAKAANPFEISNWRGLHEASVVNGDLVYKELRYGGPTAFEYLSAELIIIAPPDFLAAANDLKAWKIQKGISTQVRIVDHPANGGIGTTREQIRDYIQSRYDTATPRPSYVLLLGDAEFIPPFYRSSSGSPTTGTDLDYSLMTGGDLLADLGVARIPVDTAEQADTVVQKIIGYESTPPPSPPVASPFYDTAVMAAYFQSARSDVPQEGVTSRGYIETTELVRGGLLNFGKSVKRVYNSDTYYHPSYTGDPTPRYYRDLTPLPFDLGPSSGFSWNAGTMDVVSAINDGTFLLIHRDHGGHSGWVRPQFQTADVSMLNNGAMLPVLFSIDCATGFFDNETAMGDYGTTMNGVYLLEAMLRKQGGGIVGALGDTRDSPTWANNALTRGFADAVFPDVMSSYGGSIAIRRLADILNYGKLYMFSQVGVPQNAGSVSQSNADSENILWHAFGDPTQEIWVTKPLKLFVRDFEWYQKGFQIIVHYPVEGATITALERGLPVGRGTVKNGEAVLDLVREPTSEAGLDFSASGLGAVALQLGQ